MYATAVEMIRKEAESLGLNQLELANRANISPAQVSRILSLKSTASEENLVHLAVALKLPPEQILRVAGKLPAKVNVDPITEAASHLMNDMDEGDKQEILEYVRLRHRLAEDRKKKTNNRRAVRPADSR